MKTGWTDKFEDIKQMEEEKVLTIARDFCFNKDNSVNRMCQRNGITKGTMFRILNYCFANGIIEKVKQERKNERNNKFNSSQN